MNILSEKESNYLKKEYAKIEYEASSMASFLAEIFDVIRVNIKFDKNVSLLDIGCGKGYFLRHLDGLGYKKIKGIDPCKDLINNKLFSGVDYGSFEQNNFQNDEFDIVFTCHTLHHLREAIPLCAIREMVRIARKYIIIVEINNTNYPTFLISLLNYSVEKNAYTYNLNKVKKIINTLGLPIVYANNLDSVYISGNSIFHKISSRIGSKPYNIVIAAKNQDYR